MNKHLPVLNNAVSADGTATARPAFDAKVELPDLHQAQLDWPAVDCVLADLDDFAAIIEIQGRDARGNMVAVHDILAAQEQFVTGALLALQIVYGFADQVWCDTLMRENTGARLVRLLEPARTNES